MTQRAHSLAEAAAQLIGCPFRLHGRDPATGLDCVGLVSAALAKAGASPDPPTGYGLRNLVIDDWLCHASRSGLRPSSGPMRAGEVLLIRLPHCQHHLVICVNAASVIHAHAGLGQVVQQPLDPQWQVSRKWRLASDTEG